MTPEETANLQVAYEHFAAESAHDAERTLKTLADDIMYRVVAAGDAVYGKEAVAKYYDVWWTATSTSRSGASWRAANGCLRRTSSPPPISVPGSGLHPPARRWSSTCAP